MLEYISGSIESINPTTVVIDNHGIGYEINITLLDYTEASKRQEAKFFVHESIREDAHVLFGFLTRKARTLFRLLIGVSGVGPNTARLILSSLRPDELEQVIVSGDHALLKTVKGIGAKTAQRIIVDLKDKIKPDGDALIESQGLLHDSKQEDAIAALAVLGFPALQSQKCVKQILLKDPSLSTEDVVRLAIKAM